MAQLMLRAATPSARPRLSLTGGNAHVVLRSKSSEVPQISLRANSDGIARSLRPPLKWAGGKRWLVPYFQRLWAFHSGRRLVEPFCGGLATTLATIPERALVNDINPHPINCYRWIQKGLRIELPLQNDKATYYRYRERFNALIRAGKEESKEAAELFYYLNRTCYNGLCRFNQKGEFNVPFGKYAKIAYITDFRFYRKTIRSWEFMSGDFEKVPLELGDFVYADPPYDVEFTQYSKEGFDWDDQVRLVAWLSRHKGPVVLSNQATPRIVRLYRDRGFSLHFLSAPRMISCDGNRTPAREVLALKGV